MLILGSCVALKLWYIGCCVYKWSRVCRINGCYCDQECHNMSDCCSDIDDIGCHPPTSYSPIVLPTPTDTGKTKSEVLLLNVGNFMIIRDP